MALISTAVASVPTSGKLLVSATNASSTKPIRAYASSTAAWLAGGANGQSFPVAANAVQEFVLEQGDDLYGASTTGTITVNVIYNGG